MENEEIIVEELKKKKITRMRSIYEAVDMIHECDPDSGVNYNCIRRMCKENKVKFFKNGNKILVNYDDLLKVLGMEE